MAEHTTADTTADFGAIQNALRNAGCTQPVIVIDRGRLDANLDTLRRCAGHMDIRVVAKSLPSLELLRQVTQHLHTSRFMTFNVPMLTTLAQQMPDADQLLGKPFPVAAASQFLDQCAPNADRSVQWLIDTIDRLRQYDQLARAHDTTLRISLELDIGLHRGGFDGPSSVREAVEFIRRSDALELSGFMGYEAHLAKFPRTGGLRDRAFAAAMARYADALQAADEVLGADATEHLVKNSAGSMTMSLHAAGSVANEISFGTALLKGTDFDLDTLDGFDPAVYIAAPVLKVLDGVELPGAERVSRAAATVRRQPKRSVFIHGGHWLAEPEHPVGLSYSNLYGRSSNQELLVLSGDVALAPDDFVFLRPTQTEAVLMQFGDLAVYANGEIVDWWAPLPPSA